MNQQLDLDKRKDILVELGDYIREQDERLLAHVHRAEVSNPWFTRENTLYALDNISNRFLGKPKLEEWVSRYTIAEKEPLRVGVIAAGNIPAVAFHDLLSVFVSGNIAQIKYSDRDKYLLSFLVKKLIEINPAAGGYFSEVEKLSGFDAVVATGSNNSARYFRQYFGRFPHIIRQNKNAVAILTGEESDADLIGLGDDIFRYFGLGCRSVSHIFVPAGYDFSGLKEACETYRDVLNHSKYRNNFEYNHAIHIINQDKFIPFENILLIERDNLISPVGCLNFTYYSNDADLHSKVESRIDQIQCLVAGKGISGYVTVPFGKSQMPELWDYADGIDTMHFLTSLN